MKPEAVTELTRALTRPIIALAFVGMFVGALFTGRIDQIPDWLRALGSGAVGWWFLDRTIEKVVNMVRPTA